MTRSELLSMWAGEWARHDNRAPISIDQYLALCEALHWKECEELARLWREHVLALASDGGP